MSFRLPAKLVPLSSLVARRIGLIEQQPRPGADPPSVPASQPPSSPTRVTLPRRPPTAAIRPDPRPRCDHRRRRGRSISRRRPRAGLPRVQLDGLAELDTTTGTGRRQRGREATAGGEPVTGLVLLSRRHGAQCRRHPRPPPDPRESRAPKVSASVATGAPAAWASSSARVRSRRACGRVFDQTARCRGARPPP